MRRSLRGCNVIVTGASRGIGRNIAVLMAQLGANVVLIARSPNELNKVCDEIRAKGGNAFAIQADLTKESDRVHLINQSIAYLGGIDILVNNAGVTAFGEFNDSNEELLRRIMEINFFAPFELIRLAIPHLERSTKKPAVVNIASLCGRCGIPSFPEHCSAKFALVGLTESLRGELVRFGIDILLVIPGMVRIDDPDKHLIRNQGKIFVDWANAQTPEKVAKGIVRAIRWNWTESVVGWTALQIHRGNRIFPWLIDYFLKRKVKKFALRATRDKKKSI